MYRALAMTSDDEGGQRSKVMAKAGGILMIKNSALKGGVKNCG